MVINHGSQRRAIFARMFGGLGKIVYLCGVRLKQICTNNHKLKQRTMRKGLMILAMLAMVACTTKTIPIDDEDRRATLENAGAIAKEMEGWKTTDSLWWAYDDKKDEFSMMRICLRLTMVRGNDTLFVETSEISGNDSYSGTVRYYYTDNSTHEEIVYKNKLITETFANNINFEIHQNPDSVITASFTRKK